MSEPRIVLNESDHTVLKGLVDWSARAGRSALPHLRRLAREMAQAIVVDPGAIPDDVITMGSRVSYTCLDTDTSAEAVIVFPAQVKEGENRISILAPLATALIGEREGTEISYTAPGGTYRIRIDGVEQPEFERATHDKHKVP